MSATDVKRHQLLERYFPRFSARALCSCGHIDVCHQDQGKGACVGLNTALDYPAEPGNCGCQRFTAEAK